MNNLQNSERMFAYKKKQPTSAIKILYRLAIYIDDGQKRTQTQLSEQAKIDEEED
jgi:hypothetical protein